MEASDGNDASITPCAEKYVQRDFMTATRSVSQIGHFHDDGTSVQRQVGQCPVSSLDCLGVHAFSLLKYDLLHVALFHPLHEISPIKIHASAQQPFP